MPPLCVYFIYCLWYRGLTMGLTKNSICDFGWKARDFSLKGIDGKTYTLANVRGPKGTLVVFIRQFHP
jgi:hypothetical protein